MDSRRNAMLTTEDRRWLTGEKEYQGEHAKQQRYQRKRDIRERIVNSILDFTVLFEFLDDGERERIFGAVADDGDEWSSPDAEIENGVRNAIAFLLYSVGITALMDPARPAERAAIDAERVLTDALVRAGEKDGFLVNDVTIDIEAVDQTPIEVQSKLLAGEPISKTELQLLIQSDHVDLDDLQRCLTTMLTGPNEPDDEQLTD